MKEVMEMDLSFEEERKLDLEIMIRPTTDSDPELTGELEKCCKEPIRCHRMAMITDGNGEENCILGVNIFGYSIETLGDELYKHSRDRGVSKLLAAAAIAEGKIRAISYLEEAGEEQRKNNIAKALAKALSLREEEDHGETDTECE